MGTFEYMPPEQAGDTRSVDIRADIYSLGATLYKLLTGQPPFHGPAYNTPLKRLTALATQDPPRTDSLRADLPPELVGVIHRMLARQPEDRYATPAELAAAIAPFAQGADLAALLNAATKAPDGAMQPPLQRLVAGAASVSVRSGLVETQSQVVPPCSLQPAVQLAGSTKPPRRFKRSMLLAGAAVPIIALLGVILLSLRTPHGEIVIELADGIPAEAAKQLKIEVTGNGQVIVADAAAGWTIDVAEGRYQAKVSGGADQFQLEQKQITVTRGEKTLLSVSLKPTGEDASSVQQPNVTPQTPNTPPPATPEQAPTAAATAATAKPWQPTPEQQAFFDHVATLPAEEQAAAVAKKLTEVNPGFSGEFKHTISNGALTEFSFGVDHVTDIWPVRALQHLISLTCNGTINDRHVNVSKFADLAPLQGMHLNNLRLYNVAVSDLTPLAGMPLSHFHCTEASIRDLSPLAGMPLRNLNLYRCREIADLSPLLGAPLESLNCIGTTISDISPLQGMPLTMLAIANAPVTDLSPLKGMQLTQLQCERTHVKDLSPLSGMPLTFLTISYTRVLDLSPLKGMPLKELNLYGTSISDLSVLRTLPLHTLYYDVRLFDDDYLTLLRSLPLTRLNGDPFAGGTPILEILAEYAQRRDAALAFAEATSKLTPDKQVEAVHARLNELNDPNDVRVHIRPCESHVEDALIVLKYQSSRRIDISPLLAFKHLKRLRIINGPQFQDITWIKFLPLEELECDDLILFRNISVLKEVACSPKAGPAAMRVLWPHLARRTFHEAEAAHT